MIRKFLGFVIAAAVLAGLLNIGGARPWLGHVAIALSGFALILVLLMVVGESDEHMS